MTMAADRMETEPIERMGDNGQALANVLGSGNAIQQVRTPFTTAVSVQKPRRLRDVLHRLLEEAALAGEDFFYGWGAGKDAIEGPSVKLALAAARCYGNCAVVAQPVQDLPDSWVFTSSFVDLETGYTLDRQFRMNKSFTVYGKLDAARKEDIRFQVGQSKAIRNVVINALPTVLIDSAMQKAKDGVKQKVEEFIQKNGIAAAVDMVLRGLAKVGVKEEQVLARLDIVDRNGIDVDALVRLRGDLAAIQGGQERASELYPAVSGAGKATEDLDKKLKEKAAQGKPEETGQQQPQPSEAKPPRKKKAEQSPAPSQQESTVSQTSGQPAQTFKPLSKAQLSALFEFTKNVPGPVFDEALQRQGCARVQDLSEGQADLMRAELQAFQEKGGDEPDLDGEGSDEE